MDAHTKIGSHPIPAILIWVYTIENTVVVRNSFLRVGDVIQIQQERNAVCDFLPQGNVAFCIAVLNSVCSLIG
jgi:hypothetical protein